MATSFRTEPIFIDLSPASSVDGAVGTHQKHRGPTMTIQCLSALTPLDMMDMSFGIADPTGSCVWLGAWLFMEMFSRDLGTAHTEMQKYWFQIRRNLVPLNCHALELGAGTGMAGLSLMVMRACNGQAQDRVDEESGQIDISPGPSLLLQTDVNDDALELCRINRDENNIDSNGKGCICVEKLEWGKGNTTKTIASREENKGKLQQRTTQSLPMTFDVVFATDVLYDLASLVPLVTTAGEKLKEGGHFILSHVPRASIDDDDDHPAYDTTDSWKRLEAIIIGEASKVNLVLASFPLDHEDISCGASEAITATNIEHNNLNNHMILRPSLLPKIWRESSSLSQKYSWHKMTDVGAAIFVFQKH